MGVIAITGTRRSGTTAEAPAEDAAARDELEATVVVAQVGDRALALLAAHVEEVQPATQLKRMPGAAPAVEGFVNLHGEMVPVLDGRRLLGLPRREICLTDLFVIVRTATQREVVHVDGAAGLTHLSMKAIAAALASTPEGLSSAGMVQMADGLLVVHDTDAFVAAGEMAPVG